MADKAEQPITGLPKKTTANMLDSDYMFLQDNAEGYLALVTDVGNYILNKLTSKAYTVNGSNQTLINAINKLANGSISDLPRCKDITSYVTDGSLWTRINNNFDDLMPGDYIKMSRNITCPNIDGGSSGPTGSQYITLASRNGKYGDGDSKVITYNHTIWVPGQGLAGTQHFGTHQMNKTDTTEGGYHNSVMNKEVIGDPVTSGSTASGATINQQLYAEFGSHLKTFREITSNAMVSTNSNRYGTATGSASGWSWNDYQAILLNEAELYGSTIWSSSGFDTGTGHHQFELFAMCKRAINNRSAWYWLRDMASSSHFAHSGGIGYASYYGASASTDYVRPCFILAA